MTLLIVSSSRLQILLKVVDNVVTVSISSSSCRSLRLPMLLRTCKTRLGNEAIVVNGEDVLFFGHHVSEAAASRISETDAPAMTQAGNYYGKELERLDQQWANTSIVATVCDRGWFGDARSLVAQDALDVIAIVQLVVITVRHADFTFRVSVLNCDGDGLSCEPA